RGNKIMGQDFCQVWRELQSVLDRGMKVNLREAALKNVVQYMSLYKQDCVEKEALQSARAVEPERSVKSPSTSRMSFDPEGRIVGAGSQDSAVRVYSSTDGSLLKTIDTGEFTDAPSWLDGGRLLAFGDWK